MYGKLLADLLSYIVLTALEAALGSKVTYAIGLHVWEYGTTWDGPPGEGIALEFRRCVSCGTIEFL